MLLSLLSKRSLEVDSRDAYGFVLRPQHIQTYREYADIYEEEEEERSAKWEEFLERHMQSTAPCLAKDKKATFNSEVSSSVKQEACAAEQSKRSQVAFSEVKEGNASKEEAEETLKSESKEFNDTTASEDGSEAALTGNAPTVAETTDSKEGTNSNEKVENKASKADSVPGDENSESLQDEGTELKDEAAPKDPLKETLEAKSDALVEETGTEGTASEDGSEAALNGNDIEAKENIFSEAHNITTVAEITDSKEGTNSNEKVENKASKAYSVPGDENSESLQDEGTELKDEAAPKDPMKETLEAKSDALVKETGAEGTATEDGSEAAVNGNDIEAKENIFSEVHNVTMVAETTDSKEGTNSNEKVENKASKADSVPGDENSESLQDEGTELKEEAAPKDPMKETLEAKSDALVEEAGTEGSDEGNTSSMKSELVGPTETETNEQVQVTKTKRVQQWARTRPALLSIENLMSSRVKRAKYIKEEDVNPSVDHLLSTKEEGYCREESKNGLHENVDISGIVGENVNIFGKESNQGGSVSSESFSWKVELESLVCGGIPKNLRGEVWQAFVGVKARRVENYYQNLLAEEATDAERNNSSNVSRKWKRQIEKDLPRTFPGHPALNDVGRESLRRVLLAYARHNPTVGYCQAMNFFAGLLLLLMPEENAFWTLLGIVDDYFDGCYTEEMVESQVDQLVFDELMRERFPKLVNHLDYLGVQVAWISGPWFLSIFVNVLPWESVLRVWDVLLFEGNRVILFRTAFALMELYGPALITTRDAGDAITLLQSLAGSTFDSSQLVLTACMGFLAVTEGRLKELRDKHRPSVQGVFEERDTGQPPKDPKGLASKLKSFKHDGRLAREEAKSSGVPGDGNESDVEPDCFDEFLNSLTAESENSLPDLQDQVDWMKVELCRLLEEKRSAILRAEELEIALTEMVQNDNRRQLTAKIEQLKRENADLQQSIADKREQESAMLKVLMRLEREQKMTEEGRRKAEQEAVAQKFAVKVLEEKYEEAMIAVVQMEKRAVVAETMLEASKKYESGQAKALCSPRAWRSCSEGSSSPGRRGLLSFGLGWLEKTKGKSRPEETGDSISGPSSSEKMLIP